MKYTLEKKIQGTIGFAIEKNGDLRVIEKLVTYINPSEYDNEALVLSVIHERLDVFKLLIESDDVQKNFKNTSVEYHKTGSETQIIESLSTLIIKLNRYEFAKVLFTTDTLKDNLEFTQGEYLDLLKTILNFGNEKYTEIMTLLLDYPVTLNDSEMINDILKWFIGCKQFMCKDNIRPQLRLLLKQINNNDNNK